MGSRRNRTAEGLKTPGGDLGLIVNAIPDPVVLKDSQHRIVLANDAACAFMGVAREEITGQADLRLLPKEQVNVCHEHDDLVLKTGRKITCEEEIIDAKGNVRNAVVTRALCKDHEGTTFVLVTYKDITGQRQAEESLRRARAEFEAAFSNFAHERRETEKALSESQERYKDLYENANDMIITLDPEGRVTSSNLKARQVFGYDDKTRKALDLLKVLTPESCAYASSIITRALSEDSDLSHEQPWEFEAMRADGTPLFLEVRARLIRKDTEIIGIQAIARDITERKQAEAQRKKLQAAIDAAVEAVYVLSADGIIEYVNPGFCRMSGYSAAEVTGENISIVQGDKDDDSFCLKPITTQSAKRAWSGRGTGRRKDSALFRADVTVSPIPDAAGTIVNYVGVCRDITEEMRLEGQLRHAHKMEAIGTLAGGIAHDFNNILAAIIGFTEIAIDEAKKNPLLKRSMQQVLQAGLRGRDLARQILTFSRKTEHERQPLSLAPFLKETVKLLRASLPTVSIQLDIETESDTILAGASEVQQIVLNLGTNAAHAMQESGGIMRIRLTDAEFPQGVSLPHGMAPGSYIEMDIIDTGCGIAPDVREKIFEPFFTTKPSGQGTGLGLSVVAQIVKDLQGGITVSSELRKGSCFRVFFPKAHGETVAPEEKAGPKLRGNERILLIEDEKQLVDMVKEMLERRGYKVTGRTAGTEALKLFTSHPSQFDLVITDQVMPGMTGTELITKLLSIRPDIPIVLMTGHNETLSESQARAAGAMALLMKPFGGEEIARTIRSALESRTTAS